MKVNSTLSSPANVVLDVPASKKHYRALSMKQAKKLAGDIMAVVEQYEAKPVKRGKKYVPRQDTIKKFVREHKEEWKEWQKLDTTRKDILVAEQVLDYYFWHHIRQKGSCGTWLCDKGGSPYAVGWAWGETKESTVAKGLWLSVELVKAAVTEQEIVSGNGHEKARVLAEALIEGIDKGSKFFHKGVLNEALVFVYWVMCREN